MCKLLGLDGEAVEYVLVLVACDRDDFADEDSVGTDDLPAPALAPSGRRPLGRGRSLDARGSCPRRGPCCSRTRDALCLQLARGSRAPSRRSSCAASSPWPSADRSALIRQSESVQNAEQRSFELRERARWSCRRRRVPAPLLSVIQLKLSDLLAGLW
jgi:hypothetical protein